MKADVFIDLEELGCGDLMIALMKAMKQVEPRQVLHLRAADPGAPADIPAWCGLTGHTLLAGPCGDRDEDYYIEKKG